MNLLVHDDFFLSHCCLNTAMAEADFEPLYEKQYNGRIFIEKH